MDLAEHAPIGLVKGEHCATGGIEIHRLFIYIIHFCHGIQTRLQSIFGGS
jgi:hypothetical protein